MPGLRRTLGAAESFGLSLSMIAPTMAIAFASGVAAQSAGRAVPLAFLIGMVAMSLVCLSFVAFSRRLAHAGSVYAYVGHAFGSRFGFLTAWLLLLSYAVLTACTTAIAGNSAAAVLAHAGIETPGLWLVLSLAVMLIATRLAWTDALIAARIMMVFEGLSVLAILVLAIVILTQVPLSAAPFVPDAEHGWSGLGFALVFAVLAYAGFEGATTLGEEAQDPKRAIPLAVIATMVISGVFYIVVTYAQVLGYGLDNIQDLAESSTPLDALSTRFISPNFAVFIDLAAASSALACSIGSRSAAARLLYALSRAGLSPALGVTHPRHNTPTRAVLAVTLVDLAGLLLWGAQAGAFGYSSSLATLGTLALVAVYMTVAGAAMMLAFRDGSLGWGIACGAGAVLLFWPLWNSIYPVPDWPANLWPYVIAAWMAVGVYLANARHSAEPLGGVEVTEAAD